MLLTLRKPKKKTEIYEFQTTSGLYTEFGRIRSFQRNTMRINLKYDNYLDR